MGSGRSSVLAVGYQLFRFRLEFEAGVGFRVSAAAGQSPVLPPTPPYMRVCIRRFRRVELKLHDQRPKAEPGKYGLRNQLLARPPP